MTFFLFAALLVTLAVVTKACPGSPVAVHAKCDMSVKFTQSCDSVASEISARVNSDWTDPHNGGTYSLSSSNSSYIAGQRVTGDGKYTDKFDFMLSENGKGCLVEACSESQVMSIADFSTNYCNLHDLYCSSADGCTSVGAELTYEESYTACVQHDDVCISSAAGKPPQVARGNEKCDADIANAAAAIADAGITIDAATKDCVDGYTSQCNADIDRILNDLLAAGDAVTAAVTDCGGDTPSACTDDILAILDDIADATVDITDAVVDCGKDSKACADDIAKATEALVQCGKDIAKATDDC